MGRKKKDTMELRFYEMPQNQYVLALLGEEWIREYGNEIVHLHFHNVMEIGYCRDGRGTMQFDEKIVPYEPGMISVIPRNYPHTTSSETGKKSYWEYLFIDVEALLRTMYPDNGYFQKKILNLVNQKAEFCHRDECGQLVNITLAMMEEMRVKNEFYTETVKSLATALLFEIARMNNDKPEEVFVGKSAGVTQISKALDFISTDYREPIKIEYLADLCNMSETHFRRLFVEYMNMTPVDYINLVRVQMACENMKKSNDSMDEIAIRSGFATTSTFNRNFKRIVGTTPYQWKKNPENYENKLLKVNISAEKGW